MSLDFRYKLVNKGQDMNEMYWLMYNLEMMHGGKYPFFITSQVDGLTRGLKNFARSANGSNGYFVIYIGTHEECDKQLSECLEFLRSKYDNFQY
jgi:hypothetical protein